MCALTNYYYFRHAKSAMDRQRSGHGRLRRCPD